MVPVMGIGVGAGMGEGIVIMPLIMVPVGAGMGAGAGFGHGFDIMAADAKLAKAVSIPATTAVRNMALRMYYLLGTSVGVFL